MAGTDFNREMGAIWRDLLRDMGRTFERAATSVEGLLEEEIDEPEIRSRWGRKVLRLEALGLEEGMTTKGISTAIGLNDEPNAEKVLAQLEKNGLVELIANTAPKRWRLSRDQRRKRILRASRMVPEGKWTTYGDMAVAVYGHIQGARAVSRVASKDPAFANPHRVLEKAGTIPGGWEDDEGRGPEECARRLASEGILVEGEAPADRRMYHDELRALLDESEADDEAA
jgi:alkylated DNA nucleotide flippase Atl1